MDYKYAVILTIYASLSKQLICGVQELTKVQKYTKVYSCSFLQNF